jgi:hypothetical protein
MWNGGWWMVTVGHRRLSIHHPAFSIPGAFVSTPTGCGMPDAVSDPPLERTPERTIRQ